MSKLSLRMYGYVLRMRLAWRKLLDPAGFAEAERYVDQSVAAQLIHLEREREEARLRGEVRLTDLQLAALKVVNHSSSRILSEVEVRRLLIEAKASKKLSLGAVQRILGRLAELEILQQLDAGYYRRLKSPAEEQALIEAEEQRRKQFMEILSGKIEPAQ